jgi:hypothetical protein
MILLIVTILIFIGSVLSLNTIYKNLSNIGNNFTLVANDIRVKEKAKLEYAYLTSKYARFWFYLLLFIIAINALFIYANFNPQILK